MALRVHPISDLHIEHDPETLALELPDAPASHVTTRVAGEVDLILVPGDIDSFRRPGPLLSLLRISNVLACLGNHDFWGTSLPKARKEWDDLTAYVNQRAENLGLPGRLTLFTGPGEAIIQGVRFIVATLWTNLDRNDPLTRLRVASAVNDFTRIEGFTPDVWLAENERDFAFLSERLEPGEWTTLPFARTRMTARRMQAGSRLLVVVDVLKDAFHQVNMGTGGDVSGESIADAGAPLTVDWHTDSVVRVPLLREVR